MNAPMVTMLARVDEVRLGDVVDSVDGLVMVREIVQRSYVWDLAGDPPGHVRPAAWRAPEPEPLIRRSLPRAHTIRVRRAVAEFGRLRGHSKNVHSHAPVKQGWYTDPGGYDAECSCGWKSEAVHASRPFADVAWLGHKAQELTRAAFDGNSALAWLASVEGDHELPPVPWVFTRFHHGPREGAGIAEGALDGLPLERAREVMAAWAAVPGFAVDADGTYEARQCAGETIRGPRPGHTYLRLAGDAAGARFAITARIDDPPDAASCSCDGSDPCPVHSWPVVDAVGAS